MSGPPAADRWRRVEALFHEAIEQGPEGWRGFLDGRCGDETRVEIERLIAADDRGRTFFDRGAMQFGAPPPEVVGGQDQPGRCIGRYRLLEPVGAGGMGTVWRAERADDEFQKQVAVKLIKPGMDSDEILTRFRYERQVLATLEHPYIARLLDGGATDDGRPFLVMEYVPGVPIDRYCEEAGLDVTERLRLFLRVCEAVQHAHRNLVIHRDLKPGNILVVDGEPRLLDFGTAKLLNVEGSAQTLDVTATGVRLLTPRYASPEQVRGDPITTSTDVYSLGVVLYELLTGDRPYDVDSQARRDYERAVLESEPVRPSTCVTRRATAGVDTARLRRRLAGDLDTIVLMALRKEPERRYASVEMLATDIRRHLEGLPVLARPDTLVYRATRFVRRNRSLVASIAIVLVLLAGWLVTSTVLFIEASDRADDAWLAQQAAERQRDETRRHARVANLVAAESLIRDERVGDAARRLDAVPADLRGWEWRHLRRRVDRSLRTLPERVRPGSDLAFLPDGRLASLGPSPAEFQFWDVDRGEIVDRVSVDGERRVRSYERAVDGFAFSPDGGRVAWVARPTDDVVRVSRVEDGTLEKELPYLGKTVAWSPDGRLLCCAHTGALTLADARTGEVVHDLERVRFLWKGHPAFSADGSLVAIFSWAKSFAVWNTDDGSRFATIDLSAHLHQIAFSHAGRRLAGATMWRHVNVWDLDRLDEPPLVLPVGVGFATAVAFSPDDRRIATGGEHGGVRIFDATTGELEALLLGHTAWVASVAFNPDGTRVATSDADGQVKIWDPTRSEVPTILVEPMARVRDLRCSRDGGRVVTSAGPTVTIWDTATLEVVERLTPCDRPAISPDGNLVVFRDGDGLGLRDLELGVTTRGPEERFERFAFSPDGRLVALVGPGSTLRVWDVTTRSETARFVGDDGVELTSDLRFHPEGSMVAAGLRGGEVGIWDVTGAVPPFTLEKRRGNVTGLAFHPGGERLATASGDERIVIWDLASRRAVAEVDAGRGTLDSVAFSHDGTRLAVGAADATVTLWSYPQLQYLVTLHGHSEDVEHLLFHPEDDWLASTGRDGTLRFWQTGPDE